jgi:hypothetical protein
MTGAGLFYQPTSADYDTSVRWDRNPQGVPAPTGYYLNMNGVEQGVVSESPISPYVPGGREEVLNASERVDQHPFLQVTATWTPSADYERPDGHHDPLTDGPPAPVVRNLQLFYQVAQGTSITNFQDVPGRTFPAYGSQDGAAWTYYQDPNIALVDPPCGVAPYAGIAYNPTDSEGITQAQDTLRALPASGAHGWTSVPVINAQQLDIDKAATMRQQRGAHRDLISNSTAAGQTFTQQAAHLPRTVQGSTPSWRTRG